MEKNQLNVVSVFKVRWARFLRYSIFSTDAVEIALLLINKIDLDISELT